MIEDEACLETEAVQLSPDVSREFLLHHRLCPVRWLPDRTLMVATEPDSLHSGLSDIAFAYAAHVTAAAHEAEEVRLHIERLTTAGGQLLTSTARDAVPEGSEVRDLANQPVVVRYVSLLIRDACAARASDIHLESGRNGFAARIRVDGVLIPGLTPPVGLQHAIISRVKLLADLDIADRRNPQDGRMRLVVDGAEVNLRVSTVPTIAGESVVLRLLERDGRNVALADLGMPLDALLQFRRVCERPHGLVLVAGPTGSGKTTTLYAALGLRSARREKIITVENPVEYAIDGVMQMPVEAHSGVTFPTALRSILRQDPDVIMIGEMRDSETAEMAVQAALTGHMVFSTLHTNDAAGGIPRLIDLGLPPYVLANALDVVLAQRLVRRICVSCREPHSPDETLVRRFESAFGAPEHEHVVFMRGRGCDACRGTGYSGRIGLFEMMVIDDEMREAIATQASRDEVHRLALAGGMITLRRDGHARIREGVTTIEEVLRVTGE